MAKKHGFAGPIMPGPKDLTADKIVERMKRIHIGDTIVFDSQKEAYNTQDVDRHSSTIKATGEVVEHHEGWLMVKLNHGVLETVTYFGIETVNGKKWPWYIKPEEPEVLYKRIEEAKKGAWF